MRATSLNCPSCRAPLTPPEEGTRTVCTFCGVLILLDGRSRAADFEASLKAWRNPEAQGFHGALELGDSSWITGQRLGGSSTSEVYMGQLARRPTGFGIVRVVRAGDGAQRATRAWEVLSRLWTVGQQRPSGAFVTRLPIPLVQGVARGLHEAAGRHVVITGWRPGYHLTLREAQALHGGKIPATSSVWVWRRLLETLEFMHRVGIAHGAILPQHVLVEDGEHGLSLVGFGSAGTLSDRHAPCPDPRTEDFTSKAMRERGQRSIALDLQMSARTVIDALGGDAASASVPAEVPAPLGSLLREIALATPDALEGMRAMELRGRIGEVSSQVFGAPAFHPLTQRSGERHVR